MEPSYYVEALLVLACVGGVVWLGRYVVRNYTEVIHPSSGDYRQLLNAVFLFSLSLIAFAFLAAVVIKIEGWEFGTFGDFFGGVVNPILTFITIIGLIVTIVTQQEAAKEGRIQAARQLFDSTFFQMLSTHNSIVNALEVENDERKVLSKGRYCFKDYYLTLKSIYNITLAGGEIHKIGAGYKIVIGLYQPDLAHYFRFLYNMVRLIDTSPCTPDEKMNYIRLLRAQLSNYETAMLFYNSLMSYGKNFRRYIKKYALLDNLPPGLLFKPDHLSLLDQPAFDLDAESSAKPN